MKNVRIDIVARRTSDFGANIYQSFIVNTSLFKFNYVNYFFDTLFNLVFAHLNFLTFIKSVYNLIYINRFFVFKNKRLRL